MTTITRQLQFDYGHRVLGHGGRCRHLHGHRGVAEITVQAPELNDLGMVVDFSLVKELVGGWIDKTLDHNMLLHQDDPLLELTKATPKGFQSKAYIEVFGGRPPFVMPTGNPTAENIAQVIYQKAEELLAPRGLTVVLVRLFETPNCWADYRPNRVQ